MRALAATLALALLALGCARPDPAPRSEPPEKTSYNRRELESRPGVFTGKPLGSGGSEGRTGKDGVWTIHRSDEPPLPPPPKRPTTLSCERGHVCDPPAAER